MALFTGVFVIDFISIIIGIIAVLYAYFQWNYQIWKRKGIPYFKPKFPVGNIQTIHKDLPLGEDVTKTIQEANRRGWRYFGMFFGLKPVFVPLDLDIIKNIVIKDFSHFTDKGEYINEKDDPLSANLFTMGGHKWKTLRTKLSPHFTSGKIRGMFQNFLDCSSTLENNLKNYKKNEPIDVKHVLSCYSIDIIGACAFGIQCNSFQDSNNPFLECTRNFVKRSKLEEFRNIILISFPNLSKILRLKLLPNELSNFFYDLVTSTINHREKNNISKKDFLQLLIDMKKNEDALPTSKDVEETTLTIDEIVAQCFIFFLAGFETSSSTATFALYELSQHSEIQEKVREELFKISKKHNNKFSYESLNELEYMQQVIDETLRKYTPLAFVFRQSVKDYKIADTDVFLEKGSNVLIPLKYIHYNEEFHENPHEFKPERFSKENKQEMRQYSHLPFGEGPRTCPGMRFGVAQTKLGLATILKNYRVTLDQKTKTPIELDPKAFVTLPKDGMWLNLEKFDI